LGVGGGYRFLAGRPAVEIDTGRVVDASGEVHRGDLVVVCPGHDADPLGGDPLAGAPLRRCRLLLLQTAPLTEPLMTSWPTPTPCATTRPTATCRRWPSCPGRPRWPSAGGRSSSWCNGRRGR
ncbi:MAG: hypothetical protein H0U89_10315, partial [Acidimicrobiia bacterium]|nr:hypothetical protein [Acidimicrobiia bacterium]